MMDDQRLERIAAAPGRATMDDVNALVAEVRRLRAAFDKINDEISWLDKELEITKHGLTSRAGSVPR